MSSSFSVLGIESCDLSQAEKERKNELLAKLNKFTKWQLFSPKIWFFWYQIIDRTKQEVI